MRQVTIEKLPTGFGLVIDGKPAKTPLGKNLLLPDGQLAEAIAEEWRAQGNKIRKETMRLMQIASIAIDIAGEKREELLSDILSYADTDLLCYRNREIPELFALQKTGFDPWVAWAEKTFDIGLQITDGIMPAIHAPENRKKLVNILFAYSMWKLAVFASAVKPLASVILALALTEQKIDAEEAFRLSHLEETYQTGNWGKDDEKEQRIAAHMQEIQAAGAFLKLLSE
jgi:chaperone required for assembly of F1-ATPase